MARAGVPGSIVASWPPRSSSGTTEPQRSSKALDRAIDEAREDGAKLVVVAVAEMPLNPEGPQNFGTLDDSPARMIPLVEPPELEPVLAEAK